jgi:hypothetical protein
MVDYFAAENLEVHFVSYHPKVVKTEIAEGSNIGLDNGAQLSRFEVNGKC